MAGNDTIAAQGMQMQLCRQLYIQHLSYSAVIVKIIMVLRSELTCIGDGTGARGLA